MEQVESSGGGAPDTLCTLCEEAKANLEFGPCGHVIMCAKCGERIKKCLECKQIVESRKIIDNDPQVNTQLADCLLLVWQCLDLAESGTGPFRQCLNLAESCTGPVLESLNCVPGTGNPG